MGKTLTILGILLTIVKTCSILPFAHLPQVVWYSLVAASVIYGIIKGNEIYFSKLFLIFCAWSIIGLIIASPPSYFKAYERLFSFILNLCLLSPLIYNHVFNKLRKKLFKYSIIALHIIVFASFGAYLLGINLATKVVIGDVYWGFGGITNHSMTLAPCAAITCIFDTWVCLFKWKEFSRKFIFLWIVSIIVSIWIILVCGSRGTLMGTILSLMILYLFLPEKKKILSRTFIIITIGIILLPNSVYDSALYSINRKMSSAERHNSLTSSRDAKWDARINEFLDNPVFGIGFATQTHYTPDDDEAWIKTTGNIEPGSSWLALLAMTGIIGFILIAIINYRILHTLYLYRAKPIDILLFTLIIFFILHGIIEGWIIFAGGYIFYLYWLLLGMCFTEIRSQSDQNNLLKL